jgi:delta8-fatty-acid desaturase
MQAYRIGKVQQPWTNFIPPLRGGVFRKHGDEEKRDTAASEDEDESAWGAESTSSSLSTPSLGPTLLESGTLNKETEKAGLTEETANAWHTAALRKRTTFPTDKLSRAAYTAALEKQEIADDILAYPSLDVETQLAIRREYQDLHDRIKAEGHYQCRYSEYGKDSIRWGAVFALFAYTLYIEWYCTAAMFLGLFWVSWS